MIRISAAELTRFTTDVFVRAGVPAEEARRVAESLVEANLRGHDSHGVMRIKEYLYQLRSGELVAGAPLRTLSETDSVLSADAGFGFGQVQMSRLIERLEPKARAQGIACGTLQNCGHVGRLGEWVEEVARRQLAALMAVNDNGVLKCVAPPGGTEPTISTNPIAIAVPTAEEPVVLDMSTSVVANGKIRVARLAGRKCPPGWLQDADGNPTTDPQARFTGPPGTILPLGGADSYKGFGLGLLLDMLIGGLSGGNCPPADASAAATNNVLLVIWDPERFAGGAHFAAEAQKLMQFVRSSRRKPGVNAIRLPGERGLEMRQQRLDEGIPLDDGTWRSLTKVADKVGAPLPSASTS